MVIRNIKQSTVYLFLFRVFDDYENDIIDEKELSKVLKFLLNYSVRRLVCEIGSNSLRGLYKTLYGRVYNQVENKDHYYDSLVSFMQQLTSKDVIPSDADFISSLMERNLYRKNALCKYLLLAIENQGKEKIETDNLSIEHIMPQNKKLSKNWQTMLGDNWETIHNKYLHTIGNLTLTGYNSELGDRSFEQKKQKLENPETPTHISILYKDILNQDSWNEKTITQRSSILSSEVLKLFNIEPATIKVDFTDSRYQLYKVTEPKDATWKVVNYYELLGERVNVNSFAEMVRSVAVKLYELDSSVIEQMAKTDEKFANWQIPIFSYDKKVVKGDNELKSGTGIYISTGYSAYDCIWIIKELLKKHDLDIEEDFVYSARANSQKSDE